MANPRVTEAGNSQFSIRLKQLRLEKGYSQKQIADKVGLHSIHYGRYERGDSLPAAETLTKLADALGVSVDYLLEGESKDAAVANFEDKDLLRIFSELEKLPAEKKDAVKMIVETLVRDYKVQQLSAKAS
ncbi:MAG: helix-turn-helix domain-containing protein [Bacteroidota bacterium]